jgi:iron complex transport system permease protein
MNRISRTLSEGIVWQLLVLFLMLAALVVISSGLGYMRISFSDVLRIVLAKLLGMDSLLDGVNSLFPVVITDVRLPRILTAASVGAGLALSGVVFQGILLNPLADPYTLGVSAGAALGASFALWLNIGIWGIWSVPLFAFIGSGLTLLAVIYLASSSAGLSSNNLILSGIIVSAILSAGVSFIKYMVDEQVSVIIFWLMGSFGSKTWTDVWLTVGALTTGVCVCGYFSRELNVMALGSRTAASLGVDTRKVRMILLITASLVSAVCVSVSGIIGFVGLLVPHIMRTLTGPDNQRLILVSLFAGAILLLGTDTITRAVLPHEIPIGVLTALTGGPFFCYIYRKRQTGGIHDD